MKLMPRCGMWRGIVGRLPHLRRHLKIWRDDQVLLGMSESCRLQEMWELFLPNLIKHFFCRSRATSQILQISHSQLCSDVVSHIITVGFLCLRCVIIHRWTSFFKLFAPKNNPQSTETTGDIEWLHSRKSSANCLEQLQRNRRKRRNKKLEIMEVWERQDSSLQPLKKKLEIRA